MAGIPIDRFSAEVNKILEEYGAEIQRDVNRAAEDASLKGVQMLKSTSPVNQDSGTKRKPGKYARGWKVKKEGSTNNAIYIVHNATDYQLTHLLEFGHPLKRGGRQYGYAKAYPHIKAAEDFMIDYFQTHVIEAISR